MSSKILHTSLLVVVLFSFTLFICQICGSEVSQMGAVGHSADSIVMDGPGRDTALEMAGGLGMAVYFRAFSCLLLCLYVAPTGEITVQVCSSESICVTFVGNQSLLVVRYKLSNLHGVQGGIWPSPCYHKSFLQLLSVSEIYG